jgi:hypothetical protein
MMRNFDVLFESQGLETALIDTGVVIFSPRPFSQLLTLLRSPETYVSGQQIPFNMIRFELYNELLCATQTSSTADQSFESYLQQVGATCGEDISSPQGSRHPLLHIWEQFSTTRLKILYIHGGTFKHVGTSKEVLDLLVSNASTSVPKKTIQSVRSDSMDPARQPILVNSIYTARAQTIRQNTMSLFCEHCILSDGYQEQKFNADFLPTEGFLSNLYSIQLSGMSHCVPSNMILQQAFLNNTVFSLSKHENAALSLLILLGVEDDVKANYLSPSATIYGVPWTQFFKVRPH